MTWVIRKLKLGITKQDTETNSWNKPRIRFARPKVLIKTCDYRREVLSRHIRSDRATNIPFNLGWRKFVFIQNIILNEMYHRIHRIWLSYRRKKWGNHFYQIAFIYEKKREKFHQWEKYSDCESAFEDQFVTRPYFITSDQINLDISLSISCVFCYSQKLSRPGFAIT